MRPEPWWQRGACRGANPALFEDPRAPKRGDWSEARQLCGSCPVLTECRRYVLRHPPSDMFAAGWTPDQILTLLNRKRQP